MAVSIDAIFKPLNAFFSQKFGAPPGSPISFRFAHLARAFAPSDFIGPAGPDPSAAIAAEVTSIVSDGMTYLDPDTQTVWVQTARISDYYHDQVLGPAIPCIPPDTGDGINQSQIDSFNTAKADALARWENVKLLSHIEGIGVEYRPTIAMPVDWWNAADPGMWTHQKFDVSDANDAVTTSTGNTNLLRMKVNDDVMRALIQKQLQPIFTAPEVQPPPPHVLVHPPMLSPATIALARPMSLQTRLNADAGTTVSPQVLNARTVIPGGGETGAIDVPPRNIVGSGIARNGTGSVGVHDNIIRTNSLPFNARYELQNLAAANAATQPVQVAAVTVSFDYCVVALSRPWIHLGFLNNSSWCIPGQPKGQLSANDGVGLPALTVGFVAIKALSIQAPWTPQDITNIEQSVQFGPFNIDSNVTDGAIGHDGVQIMGWMLQALPALAPR